MPDESITGGPPPGSRGDGLPVGEGSGARLLVRPGFYLRPPRLRVGLHDHGAGNPLQVGVRRDRPHPRPAREVRGVPALAGTDLHHQPAPRPQAARRRRGTSRRTVSRPSGPPRSAAAGSWRETSGARVPTTASGT